MKLLFAWRYFKSKKSTNAINIIAWISVVAITVGTAALIVVLSVFNGFEGLVKSLYGDFYSDLRISAKQGKFVTLSQVDINKITSIPGVATASLTVEEKAVLNNGDFQALIYLKGVDEQFYNVNNVGKHIIRGEFNLGQTESPNLVAGVGIETAISADPLSINEVVVYLPNRSAKAFNQDAMHSFNAAVAGTFMIQQEFDNKYAFTNIGFLKYMLDLRPDEYSSMEIAFTKNADPEAVHEKVEKVVAGKGIIQTRYQQNQSLYMVMQMEKWVVYGILCLILIVAAFNMIGALTMLVLEKQKDIAVLKAMGANNKVIQDVFLYEGLLLAAIGAGAGIVIAFGVCYIQDKFHIVKLTGGSFIISHYPVKMLLSDFVLVAGTVTIVALIASWVPSRKATEQHYSLKS